MELRLLQSAGEIGSLQYQPRFPLDVTAPDGAVKNFGAYIADFQYTDYRAYAPITRIEDVKGSETEMSDFRRRLAEWLHGVTIDLVKR